MAAIEFANPMPPGSSLATFSLKLEGWQASRGGRDYLLKWITAPSCEAIEGFIEEHDLSLEAPIDLIDIHGNIWDPDEPYAGANRDANCVITDSGQIIQGSLGRIKTRNTMTP